MSKHGSINVCNICTDHFGRRIYPLECSVPEPFCLDACTYYFYHRIVAVSFSAHRWNLLCALRSVQYASLALPVCVLDLFWLGLPDCSGFVQGTDGKRLLHPVPRFPADTPAGIQIDQRSSDTAPLRSPDRTDIRSPF